LAAVDSVTFQWRLDDFVEKLRLARALGPDKVPKLAGAVFGYGGGEFSAAAGVPDLFVWDTDRQPAEWFFAEVKGPRDHLQESQTTWLRNYWDDIEGRFAVISIG
jgi:hypothetical protein